MADKSKKATTPAAKAGATAQPSRLELVEAKQNVLEERVAQLKLIWRRLKKYT